MRFVTRSQNHIGPYGRKQGSVLTPAADGHPEHVVTYVDLASQGQLQAEMEGLRGEPHERGQQEVVHDSCHDLTAHGVVETLHVVVDQER